MEDKVFYLIDKKHFFLPDEMDYIQWKMVKDVFKLAQIKMSDFSVVDKKSKKVDIKGSVGSALDTLMDKDLLPVFFAIILIPKGELYWEEKFLDKNKDIMKRIGDKTMVEVAVRFLVERESLVRTLVSFLSNFLAKALPSKQK